MLKVKSGDLDKLALIYERNWKRLFGFFFKMCGSRTISEDLVQNVFIKIIKYRHTYRSEGSFDSWIFGLSRNLFYDYYNKNVKENKVDALSPSENELHDPNDFISKLEDSDNSVLLWSALQRLNPEKREILVLSVYKGLKFREVAGFLKCSEGTARVRVFRALKDLRKIFLQLETNLNHGQGNV